MLSLRNKRENFTLLNTPVVLFILITITILRIYSLYVTPIELSVDEAQYWHWSRNIDFGYFTKPPLIAWLIGFSTFIFGNEEWAVRLFAPITHLFISLVLWGTAKICIWIKLWKICSFNLDIHTSSFIRWIYNFN